MRQLFREFQPMIFVNCSLTALFTLGSLALPRNAKLLSALNIIDVLAASVFQIIAGRAERAAVIVTTNLPFFRVDHDDSERTIV
jgi:hypothetical protein